MFVDNDEDLESLVDPMEKLVYAGVGDERDSIERVSVTIIARPGALIPEGPGTSCTVLATPSSAQV